ncbi:hypothetical protein BJ508DRAFT_23099 [Ascobolus immersus RN42]|uniref:Uncharacterized protein n=1 Tax=Ascobolus immersus RN42 TaxID=1160509 RepID=A0A3N4HPM5_ASCIM|nr:hypothetical protein BJ508DRAFT_23099 [Ascobolus immersus RN42]
MKELEILPPLYETSGSDTSMVGADPESSNESELRAVTDVDPERDESKYDEWWAQIREPPIRQLANGMMSLNQLLQRDSDSGGKMAAMNAVPAIGSVMDVDSERDESKYDEWWAQIREPPIRQLGNGMMSLNQLLQRDSGGELAVMNAVPAIGSVMDVDSEWDESKYDEWWSQIRETPIRQLGNGMMSLNQLLQRDSDSGGEMAVMNAAPASYRLVDSLIRDRPLSVYKRPLRVTFAEPEVYKRPLITFSEPEGLREARKASYERNPLQLHLNVKNMDPAHFFQECLRLILEDLHSNACSGRIIRKFQAALVSFFNRRNDGHQGGREDGSGIPDVGFEIVVVPKLSEGAENEEDLSRLVLTCPIRFLDRTRQNKLRMEYDRLACLLVKLGHSIGCWMSQTCCSLIRTIYATILISGSANSY